VTEQAVTRRMEGSAVHASTCRTNESLGARQHLVGRPPRKREKQNAIGPYTSIDEVCDAVDERTRLAGARAGDDQEWAVSVLGGRGLLWVELCGEIAPMRRRAITIARAIDAGGVHGGRERRAASGASEPLGTAGPSRCPATRGRKRHPTSLRRQLRPQVRWEPLCPSARAPSTSLSRPGSHTGR
jgi:hypothetical protein